MHTVTPLTLRTALRSLTKRVLPLPGAEPPEFVPRSWYDNEYWNVYLWLQKQDFIEITPPSKNGDPCPDEYSIKITDQGKVHALQLWKEYKPPPPPPPPKLFKKGNLRLP